MNCIICLYHIIIKQCVYKLYLFDSVMLVIIVIKIVVQYDIKTMCDQTFLSILVFTSNHNLKISVQTAQRFHLAFRPITKRNRAELMLFTKDISASNYDQGRLSVRTEIISPPPITKQVPPVHVRSASGCFQFRTNPILVKVIRLITLPLAAMCVVDLPNYEKRSGGNLLCPDLN